MNGLLLFLSVFFGEEADWEPPFFNKNRPNGQEMLARPRQDLLGSKLRNLCLMKVR